MLFLLCINHISNAVDHASLHLFADNTDLFVSGKCINDIACEATGILESLSVWFRYNQLKLNLSKTCYTIFGRHLYGTSVPLLLQD